MPQVAIAVPILPGKLEAFHEASKNMAGPEFNAFMHKYGLESVRMFHQHNADGSDLAIVVHDGPNPEKWFTEAMTADDPIAQEWRDMAADVHGMGPGQPMPELNYVGSVGTADG